MTEADVLRIVISLIFVVMLILAGAWLTRRAGWLRNTRAPALKVLGAQSLGARAYVTLVEVEDARLVLGVTSGQVTLLHTLPPAKTAAAATPQEESDPAANTAPKSFSATLNRALGR